MVKIANSGDVSDDMFRLLSTSKYTKGQSDISVTELIAPPRIRQLLARHGDKIEVDASDSIYALFGTLTHEIMQNVKLGLAGKNSDRRLAAIHETLVDLEDKKIELIDLPAKLQEAINKADEEEVYARHKRIIERRFFTEYDGLVISGAIDDLRVDEKLINDHKVCSRYAERDTDGKIDWIRQLNVYRWLAERNGISIDKLTIEAYYRDWSKRQAARDSEYPQKQTKIFEIEVWPLKKAEAYVAERVRLHKIAETLSDEMLPMCTPEERWAEETKFAVTKAGRTRAIRVLDSQHEAASWIQANQRAGEGLIIERRDGTSTRCESYCDAWSVCEFGRAVRANMRKS